MRFVYIYFGVFCLFFVWALIRFFFFLKSFVVFLFYFLFRCSIELKDLSISTEDSCIKLQLNAVIYCFLFFISFVILIIFLLLLMHFDLLLGPVSNDIY